jgi:uncharacterized Ntn-hydrolase superfamily protein
MPQCFQGSGGTCGEAQFVRTPGQVPGVLPFRDTSAVRNGTYSIVARDPETGELGVAVHSHWFSVGQLVPWLEPGVGAAAIQSVPEPEAGARLLELMRDGASPADALAEVLRDDEAVAFRQIGVVDASGTVAVHTGGGCIPHAGDMVGDGFSCQANMMAADTVPTAMARAYQHADGLLAERLVAAMKAAEAEGGDVRGRQSAALVIAPAEGEHWRRTMDLRVEDHREPVMEIARLLNLQRAYDLADEADRLAAEGDHAAAARLYEEAAARAPESDELIFWAGLGAAQGGDMETALARVREAVDRGGDRWLVLLDRLSDDIAPAASAVRAALGREKG